MRRLFSLLRLASLSVTALAACDNRPIVVDSTGALAPVGASIPEFSFPSIRGWTFDRKRLSYGHTVVALVPANATGEEPALVAFDSLQSKFSMLRYAVVYDRPLEVKDTSYLNEPSWLSGTERGFASDSQLIAAFAPGVHDSSDKHRRHVFALPSFLLISDSGRVLARSAGTPLPLRRVMDSLRAVYDSTNTAEGAAIESRARPFLEKGVPAFDPVTLEVKDYPVSMSGSCGGEETNDFGVIPAAARVVELKGYPGGVFATVEIISIADVKPEDEDDICRAEKLSVTPRIRTQRYNIQFLNFSSADDTVRGKWAFDASLRTVVDSASNEASTVLIGLDRAKEFQLPSGVTVESLRARIDSIRAARH